MPMHNSMDTVQIHPKCHLQEEHVDNSDSASRFAYNPEMVNFMCQLG